LRCVKVMHIKCMLWFESCLLSTKYLILHDYIIFLERQQIADSFTDAVWYSECPMINGNGTAKYLLSKAVRDAGIKVVFTGEGADEILAGYPTARRDLILFNSDGLDATESKRLLRELEAANRVSRGILTPHGDTAPG